MREKTDIANVLDIAGAALRAQSVRARIIAENLANADTTPASPNEQPYQRRIVTFRDELDRTAGVHKVRIDRVLGDTSAFPRKFDPTHPAADAQGYVSMPNVNPILESMDMREAHRSLDANMNMVEMARSMLARVIDLLRN